MSEPLRVPLPPALQEEERLDLIKVLQGIKEAGSGIPQTHWENRLGKKAKEVTALLLAVATRDREIARLEETHSGALLTEIARAREHMVAAGCGAASIEQVARELVSKYLKAKERLGWLEKVLGKLAKRPANEWRSPKEVIDALWRILEKQA